MHVFQTTFKTDIWFFFSFFPENNCGSVHFKMAEKRKSENFQTLHTAQALQLGIKHLGQWNAFISLTNLDLGCFSFFFFDVNLLFDQMGGTSIVISQLLAQIFKSVVSLYLAGPLKDFHNLVPNRFLFQLGFMLDHGYLGKYILSPIQDVLAILTGAAAGFDSIWFHSFFHLSFTSPPFTSAEKPPGAWYHHKCASK